VRLAAAVSVRPAIGIAADLIWTKFEDSSEWVVFNPASGDIHLLTASARRLMTLLEERPADDPVTLARTLAAELNVPPDDEFVTVTGETLAFLDQAGLIRPILP
jgi:PqqD family protein of HPr-rel-A system